MSGRYKYTIVLFSDNDYGKSGGDALVVMAEQEGDINVIPNLSQLSYTTSGGAVKSWNNNISSALVEKGKWELHKNITSDNGSKGCGREKDEKNIPLYNNLSDVVRVRTHPNS